MISRVLTCVGKQADKPYYYDKLYTNLYSIEELCFVLHENAFMIEKEVMSHELAEWIEVECGLTDLARELYQLINQNASISSFVGMILDYVGYYSSDEIEKTENILKDNVTMNAFERWKAKADFLSENGHYVDAIREYDYIINRTPQDEIDLLSHSYNNMGVTYMQLRLYDFAEECFMEAYKLNGNEEAYKSYLISKRLHLPEQEYITEVANDSDSARTDLNVQVETDILTAEKEFNESDEAAKLKELFELKSSADAQAYYERITKITEELKDNYREAVKETAWRT